MSLRYKAFAGLLALLLVSCSGPAAEPQAITVVVSGMQYQPASLEVAVGQPIQLTLTNDDALEHDLSITEIPLAASTPQDSNTGHDMNMGGAAEQPDLHVSATANSSGMIEFTPSKAGTYEFFCTVAGHKDAGMVGSLVVTAP